MNKRREIYCNSRDRIPDQFKQTIANLTCALIKPWRLKRDLLFGLLLLFMRKNGFLQLKGKDKDTTSVIDYILSLRDNGSTIYEVDFILKGFTETPLKLIGVPISEVILINAVVPSIESKSFSLCIDVNKHVDIYLLFKSCFKNYNTLQRSFMDAIVTPTKCAILTFYGYPCCNLPGLPECVIHQILLYIPVKSILSVAKSCKRLNNIVEDDRLWRHLYERDFPDFLERKNEGKDWRDTYKEMYLIRREESMRAHSVCNGLREFADMDVSNPNLRWEIIL